LLASSARLRQSSFGCSPRSETLGNFVARSPDRVHAGRSARATAWSSESTEGTVEEIGLIYTSSEPENGDRLVIPNEKLAFGTNPELHDFASRERSPRSASTFHL